MSFFTSSLIALLIIMVKPVTAAEGTINAMLYSPIPDGELISIQILDNSDENMYIKRKFEQGFREQGKKVGKDGRLLITIERRGTLGTWRGVTPNRLIQLRNAEDHTGVDTPDIRFSLFDSSLGGFFNKNISSRVTQVAASQYQINISLDDRANGRRLWQGWATIEVGKSDDRKLLYSMIPRLIENIGKTVRSQTFKVN
ncbi:MAG: hypothetical protein CFH06_00285 [Alphaproteobacteria bacterium MarineAlpha3_Bin5]|nr:hypothetical protein [Magnetovibrio sp.]PPR79648.1 MAG: hypothetical protein CFH06_00285 [Alphaproteobacteria bacterium MarineAlpha3_Bin5]